MNWYLKVLRQWSDFSGRARRKEYWFFVLFNILIFIALAIVDFALGTNFDDGRSGLFSLLYHILIIIPALAVSVRRLHDIGRSGWWLLIEFIPAFFGLLLTFTFYDIIFLWILGIISFIGTVIIFVFHVLDSEPGTNQYGPNPKTD